MTRGNRRAIRSAMAAVSLALLAACGRGEPQEQTSGDSAPSQVNFAETALVNTAHKRIGEDDRTYSNEFMSQSDGFLKVCGEFETKGQPVTKRRYFFSLEKREYFSDFDDQRWARACEAGWPPGQGPRG